MVQRDNSVVKASFGPDMFVGIEWAVCYVGGRETIRPLGRSKRSTRAKLCVGLPLVPYPTLLLGVRSGGSGIEAGTPTSQGEACLPYREGGTGGKGITR